MNNKPTLKAIAILGLTATGKTSLAIKMAKGIGEIISADSMQIYKHMDIGTAKPTTQQLKEVPHHLIDCIEPDQPFNVFQYFQLANETMMAIHKRGNIPFLVGGTGLYFKALFKGIFPLEIKDKSYREELKKLAEQEGLETLYSKLEKADPVAAQKIHPNDAFRIIRALEVLHHTGQPISSLWNQNIQSPFNFLKIGLDMDREKNYRLIEERCQWMLENGLIEETRELLKRGLSLNHPSMQAIGYRHCVLYLKNEIEYEEMKELFMRDTRRFAKRQRILFRSDPDVQWFHPNQKEQIQSLIANWI